ncbi:MAG: ImmA/IrrE family metallo-endopeptidase [Tetrasphaera sp.]
MAIPQYPGGDMPPRRPRDSEDLFDWAEDEDAAINRPLIDQLINATRLYDTAEARQDMLDFVVRFRSVAPFNAMLLQAQRPGLTHAATASDWQVRFNRRPTATARPLIILRTMGPVDFVFDVLDTEGDPLPAGAFVFPTFGSVPETDWAAILSRVRKAFTVHLPKDGDGRAGMIRRQAGPKGKPEYEVFLNAGHPPATQFVTLAHELAHLYLGHLGEDRRLRVSDRRFGSHAQDEVEAEMTAWIVARRAGVTPLSEKYLGDYIDGFLSFDQSVVLRAVNAVETAMGMSSTQMWKRGV